MAKSVPSIPKPEEDRYCQQCGRKMTWVWGNEPRFRAGGRWRSRCHPCRSQRDSERNIPYQKAYREQNPDYWKKSIEKRLEQNPNHFHEIRQRFFARHPDYSLRKNLAHRARKMGITIEQYQFMLEEQNFVCAACGNPETSTDPNTGKVRLLAIDHDHETGEVRALLCSSCNLSIGIAFEDPERLRAMADYIERCKSQKREENAG